LRPLLARLSGLVHPVRPVQPVRLAAPAPAAGPRPRVLWARLRSSGSALPAAEPLAPHPLGALAGLACADALLLLAAGTPALAAGAMVPALLLNLPASRDDLRCRPPLPLVLGLVGASGSGKTRIAAGLARRLAAAGLRVAAVKHAAGGFDLDRAGSDSDRLFRAGAAVVVLAGPGETALRLPLAPGRAPATAADAAVIAATTAAQHQGAPPQVILIEGFSHPDRPVVVVEPAKGAVPSWQILARIAPGRLDDRSLAERLDHLAGQILALVPR